MESLPVAASLYASMPALLTLISLYLMLNLFQAHNENCSMFPLNCINGCEQVIPRMQVSDNYVSFCFTGNQFKYIDVTELAWVLHWGNIGPVICLLVYRLI